MTTCGRGLHEMDEGNTYRYPDGHLRCRACHRTATQRYLQTPKGKAAQAQAQTRYGSSTKGLLRVARGELRRAQKGAR